MSTPELDNTLQGINELTNIPYVLDFAYGKARLQRQSGRGVANVSPRLCYRDIGHYLAGMLDALILESRYGQDY